jgi:hypothetical protein
VHQEIPGRPRDPPLLFAAYGQAVALALVRLARFHFDENDGGGLRRDEVDLTCNASVVAGENAVTMPP